MQHPLPPKKNLVLQWIKASNAKTRTKGVGCWGNGNRGTEKELWNISGQGKSEQQIQVNRAERTWRSQVSPLFCCQDKDATSGDSGLEVGVTHSNPRTQQMLPF